MLDIKLEKEWDIELADDGDVKLTDSVTQAILTRLKWFMHEWRLGPDIGFPWFEEVFIKNPNIVMIESRIRTTILDVKEVEDCTVDEMYFDNKHRSIRFKYTAKVGAETYTEEVELYG